MTLIVRNFFNKLLIERGNQNLTTPLNALDPKNEEYGASLLILLVLLSMRALKFIDTRVEEKVEHE